MLYEFVANTLQFGRRRGQFPGILALPVHLIAKSSRHVHFFTVTSRLIVTLLSLLVIGLASATACGERPGFFRLLVPHGGRKVSAFVFHRVLSFIRPISLSIRLFANILAGHITLKVFAGFVVMMGTAGWLGVIGAVGPLVLTVALTALEVLVAVLQAYVFAILTSLYLNDAIHPGH
jgi:F-type H+-transporting ATPase subunit a